jgi:hypothetical protein
MAHPELATQSDGDKQLLTASRTWAFRKCPRFHLLKYEELTERMDDDGREALTFGTLIHKGLEDYFNGLMAGSPTIQTGGLGGPQPNIIIPIQQTTE